jgi:hypothetical protein
MTRAAFQLAERSEADLRDVGLSDGEKKGTGKRGGNSLALSSVDAAWGRLAVAQFA